MTGFRIKSWINYWLDAVDEHSLHSPFLYDLYTGVIKQKSEWLPVVESLRSNLLKNPHELSYNDPGAGTVSSKSKRTISRLAKISTTPPPYAAMYRKLINWVKAEYIVELGTCLGLTTLYLSGNGRSVYTFEGVPVLADIAQSHFEQLQARNIHLIRGNINETLRTALEKIPRVDFALVDANHRYQPVMYYLELLIKKIHTGSVIVVDDIHLNPEMEKAWNEIRNHPLVYCSADLFRCGLLFFNPSVYRQHVVLQF